MCVYSTSKPKSQFELWNTGNINNNWAETVHFLTSPAEACWEIPSDEKSGWSWISAKLSICNTCSTEGLGVGGDGWKWGMTSLVRRNIDSAHFPWNPTGINLFSPLE